MKPYDLIVIGDLVADIIMPVNKLPLRPNEHDWAEGLFTELGGACTTLVAAQRMSLSVATLGMIGGDAYGRQVLQMLQEEGIDVSHVAVLEGRQTVLCVVVTDKLGQHVFLGIKDDEPPAGCPRTWRDIVPQTRSIFTNGYTLRDLLEPQDVFDLLEIGRVHGIPIFFDPGPSIQYLSDAILQRALAYSDVLLLTDEEARFVVQGKALDSTRALLGFGPRAVVLKAGAAGCYVATADEMLHHPGFDVEVVDTVGAGDAFVSAFISGYLQGANWRDCAALANAMGAAVVSTQGAGRCVPHAGRLREILGDDPAARLLPVVVASR